MAARIFDGAAWTDITDSEGAVHTVDHGQVAPILDGDGNIFVTIPSFRGMCVCVFVENDLSTNNLVSPCCFFYFHDMI